MPQEDESRRARSARHYLIDGPPTARLETTLALVSRAMDFPVVRVNILDEDTQYTISIFGDGDAGPVSRQVAFCDRVVRTGHALEVEDAATDARFALNPAVVNGQVGSYLGVPLLGRESLVVGAVCVIDPHRRVLGEEQLARMVEFGKIVEDQLDLMRRLKEQRQEGSFATSELAREIKSGEIVPWYQAIVDLRTGAVAGFEALARWVHPDGTVDDPRQFVPLAEDSDLIIELDQVVMTRALADLQRWQSAQPALRMSVNLSARHFDHADCVSVLTAVAADAGVATASVTLEVTETSRLTIGRMPVAGAVKELRDLGFEVWLDDFGTGWASLEQLLWLPLDGIKIDRAVAVALGTPIGDALAAAVTGLARALGLRTTIEGIENPATAEMARARGCDYGQGYLWSEPVPASWIDAERLFRPNFSADSVGNGFGPLWLPS